jgi:subtilase family serine protease
MRCFALVRTDTGGAPTGRGIRHDNTTGTSPVGYEPSQLQAAYDLPSSSDGSGQTVAIIESGDYPTAQADLNTYRSEFSLPACGSGCFTKVSQTGSTTKLPKENASWAEESALDMDMVSAICPNCHILMVEANSSTLANLADAVNEAVTLGATEISNSYGGSESQASNSAYSHSGIVITASSGDSGYAGGVEQPCSFSTVVCTGGSSLVTASNSRGYMETVWNDLSIDNGAASSGCSAYVAKPSWQTDKGCTMRSESDVSFDADPQNGVAVYDSTPYEGYVGWLEFGGTSVAAPSIASVYALAGNASSLGPNAAQTIWNDAGTGLWSVTSGNNLASGETCPSAYPYICTAGTNDDGVYSGPAGWGTPNGLTDF